METDGLTVSQQGLLLNFHTDAIVLVGDLMNLAHKLEQVEMPIEQRIELVRIIRGLRKGAAYVAENLDHYGQEDRAEGKA
jgi:chaperonin GroEL (HSP60 family)